MKLKIFFASLLIAGSAITGLAQGYQDGIEFYKIGEYSNAKELLNRNLNSAGTDKALSLYYLGQIELKYGKMWADNGNAAKAQQYRNNAKSLFDQGIAANPKCAYNYVGLGALALQTGDVKGAEEQFKLAEKQNKKDPKLATSIAREYYNVDPTAYAKQIIKRIENARKWGKEDPDSFILEGDMKADASEWGDAAGMYNMAYYYDPDNIEAHVKYANTYFKVNPAFAIKDLEDLLAKVPNSALVQRQLADKYYEDNQGRKALDMYGKLLANPNHFGQDELRYAQLLFIDGRYGEALDVVKALDAKSADDSSDKFIANRLALYSLVRLERFDEGILTGKKFFSLRANDPTEYNENDYTYYCDALNGAGRGAEAITTLENAANIYPDNPNFKRSLAKACYQKDDYYKAIEYYQVVAESPNKTINDLYQIGQCYFLHSLNDGIDDVTKSSDLNNGLTWVNKALVENPDQIAVQQLKGRLLKSRDGSASDEALAVFQKVVALADKAVAEGGDKTRYDSYYRNAYNYIGLYYLSKGDKANAKMYLQKQLEHDPNNTNLQEHINTL